MSTRGTLHIKEPTTLISTKVTKGGYENDCGGNYKEARAQIYNVYERISQHLLIPFTKVGAKLYVRLIHAKSLERQALRTPTNDRTEGLSALTFSY